jgi:antitoxin component YwqK of YwqJK toxin-antitoxin module
MYYPNGEKRGVGPFRGDKKNGTWQEFWSTGEPWRQVVYVDDVEQSGPAEACFEKQGTWLADGEKRALGCQVCRARPDDTVEQVGVGVWTFWHPSGEIEKQGSLEEGRPQGTWRFFHDNGRPMLEGTFVGGAEEGQWTGYYRDGTVRFKGRYAAGQPVGEWTSFAADAGVISEGSYDGGAKVGRWRYLTRGKSEVVDYDRPPPPPMFHRPDAGVRRAWDESDAADGGVDGGATR